MKLRLQHLALMLPLSISPSLWADTMSDEAIAERIKPVGELYLTGDTAAQALAASTEPRNGETVYTTYCSACHGAGIMGAPKIGNAGDWQARIAQGSETLTKHAITGFNAMPAKGACGDCSDDEIIAAIEHMIDGL